MIYLEDPLTPGRPPLKGGSLTGCPVGYFPLLPHTAMGVTRREWGPTRRSLGFVVPLADTSCGGGGRGRRSLSASPWPVACSIARTIAPALSSSNRFAIRPNRTWERFFNHSKYETVTPPAFRGETPSTSGPCGPKVFLGALLLLGLRGKSVA
jgi:hypothetical protein